MTTSKNFDTQPKAVEFPYFRTFDSLVGFIGKNKKKKFSKALKEEYPADVKEKIASGKLRARNLDKDPLRAKPFKNDTFFTVDEIAKYCWDNSTKLQGKFEDKKALLATLKSNKKFRELCNAKMIERIGKNKKALEPEKKPALEKDPYKIADYFFNHPVYKVWFKDLKNISDLRRMISKNPEQAEKLARIMYNENKKK